MTPETIAPLLPELFVRMLPESDVLAGLLASMAALLDASENTHERLAGWLDPRTAPAEVLPVLCRWVGMDPELAVDERALRRLVLVAPSISARRGTREALQTMLEVCTGERGFAIEEPADEPYTVRVRAPASLALRARLVEAILQAGKPAHVRHVLEWEGGGRVVG